MNWILVLLLSFCSACGYQFEGLEGPTGERTVSVPFVEGDWDGDLTSAIVHQLSVSGKYRYQREGGAYLLKIKTRDLRDENIGFRYYRNKEGHIKKDLVPTETRLFLAAEVTLLQVASGQAVLGPTVVQANVEFDHDFYSSANIFSLGQLTDYDSAYDAVSRPLNRVLAQKIVDFINDGSP